MLRKESNPYINEFFEMQSEQADMDLDALRNHFASIVCHDVSRHKLIDRKRFPDCLPKPASSFPGCIFAGVNKAGRTKKVYVKHYAKENIVGDELEGKFVALMDYAAFKILKCGRARAPKVRVCASKQESGKFNYYLFSTDIAHARSNHQDKIYYYSDLGENSKLKFLEPNGILSSRVDLIPHPQPPLEDEQVFRRPGYTYNVDYRSTARLLVLGVILQLTDLHEENVGFVLSRRGKCVKSKLTFIDFDTKARELPVGERTASLKEILHNHYHVKGEVEILVNLVARIPEEELVAAFHEVVEAGIAHQCETLRHEVNTMDFASVNMKQKFDNRMQLIERNIEKLQHFVDAKYPRNHQLIETNVEQPKNFAATKEEGNDQRKKCVIC